MNSLHTPKNFPSSHLCHGDPDAREWFKQNLETNLLAFTTPNLLKPMTSESLDNPSLADQLNELLPALLVAIQSNEAVEFKTGIAPHANGSVLCSFGNTQVICAAMVEDRVPGWMRQQKVEEVG